MKTVLLKLRKISKKIKEFSVKDNYGNTIISKVSSSDLCNGVAVGVNDDVSVLVVESLCNYCPKIVKTVPIQSLYNIEIPFIKCKLNLTTSVWKHNTNSSLYNSFYGVVNPYIIEYPVAFKYYDEVLQSVKDYTKAYVYQSSDFDPNSKVLVNDRYFNKSIIYNDEQCSGLLELKLRPQNNLKAYMSYPIYKSNSKEILYTKSDSFYQYNEFWDVVKSKNLPIFKANCESLSVDKVLNDENMDYNSRSYKKYPIRGKELRIRHILDNASDLVLVSQFITQNSQISYK